MLIAVLVILEIANLVIQLHNAMVLKRVGKEINQIEDWKSIPKKDYF